MSMSKSSKMLQSINYRFRANLQDGRQLVAQFMAYDRHMNLVLGDCEESCKLAPTKGSKSKADEEREDRRTLGLVILRGEEVISMTVEGPPPSQGLRAKSVSATALSGPGLGRAAGRGIPTSPIVQAQPGLAGPVRGIGGPTPGMMQPQFARPPASASRLSAPSMSYPSAPVIRPLGQQMPGFHPPGGHPHIPLRGPPPQVPLPGQYPYGLMPASAPPGTFTVPPPQYAQRPVPPPLVMPGPPLPRPGIQPPGGPVQVYGPPRPGIPPPPNPQQPPQSQQ